ANETDLRVLLATARISAARFLGPSVAVHVYETDRQILERAESALPRFLLLGFRGLVAALRGDETLAANSSAEGLAIAERLGLWPMVIAVHADRAWRALNGASLPEKVLEITQQARRRARQIELPPSEPMLRILACEVEALARLGRFEEAHAVIEEANALARRGSLPRYALAMPVARFYLFTDRNERLPEWADALDAEVAGNGRPLSKVHARVVRGMLATLD